MLLKHCVIFISLFICMPFTQIYAESLDESLKHYSDYLFFSEPAQLDPIDTSLSVNAHTKFLFSLIFEPLLRMESNRIFPVLARSWVLSPDGSFIEFTLNKNHRFSDGTEVTAQYVATSMAHLCLFNSQVSKEVQGILGCEINSQNKNSNPQIQVLDKYHIRFYIIGNPNSFLYQLTSLSTGITKYSNGRFIGSGPYEVQVKNNYFVALKKNRFNTTTNINNKGIILLHLDDSEAISRLHKHRLDGALMYRSPNLQSFEDRSYRIVSGDENIVEILVFNSQKYPFNIQKVRQALAAGIYNNININCIMGAEKAYGIVPAGMGGSLDNMTKIHLPEISPQRLFQIVPALKLKKATIIIDQLENFKNDCESQQIISIARKYNVDITFKFHKSYSDYWASVLNHHLNGFIESYFFKNREAYTALQFFSETGENHANLKGMVIDNMLDKAISAPSHHDRFSIYRSIDKYILNNNIAVPLFTTRHTSIVSKCLTGISENFLFNPYLDLSKIARKNNCDINE